MIPGVSIGFTWKLLLSPQGNPIQFVLQAMHLPVINFFAKNIVVYTIILLDVWQWTPFTAILLLAGLRSISVDVMESGQMDGAYGWTKLRYLTLPMLVPTILITLVLRTVRALQMYDAIWVLTRGGPGTQTEMMSIFVVRRFIDWHYVGYSSATAFMFAVLAIVVGLIYIRVLLR